MVASDSLVIDTSLTDDVLAWHQPGATTRDAFFLPHHSHQLKHTSSSFLFSLVLSHADTSVAVSDEQQFHILCAPTRSAPYRRH